MKRVATLNKTTTGITFARFYLLRFMKMVVLIASENYKIFKSVIILNSVDMMNVLVWKKPSFESFFHYKTMFKHSSFFVSRGIARKINSNVTVLSHTFVTNAALFIRKFLSFSPSRIKEWLASMRTKELLSVRDKVSPTIFTAEKRVFHLSFITLNFIPESLFFDKIFSIFRFTNLHRGML